MPPTLASLVAARMMTRPLLRPPALVRRWSVGSQARSRRNALVANSALTARRLEREEVERFLSSLGSGRITA